MGKNAELATIAMVLALIVSLVAGGAPAHADDDASRNQARKLLEAGDRHMQRGQRHQRRGRTDSASRSYERALGSYQKAYELVPNPAIFFAIAGAEEKLGRWLDALEHCQRVIREVDSEELRQQARERIKALEKHLARVHFEVRPEGAEISIDRQLRGQAPLDGPVFLMPGDYRVTVTAPGYTPHEAVITVEAGRSDERVIELSKIPVVVKRPKRGPAAVVDEEVPALKDEVPVAPGKAGVVVGASLTMALLAGATATGLIALSKHDTFEDPAADPAARSAAQDSGKLMALVTDGLLAGAVITGTYTAYRYFFVYRPERAAFDAHHARSEPTGAPSIWVAPYAAAGGGGVAAGGRF